MTRIAVAVLPLLLGAAVPAGAGVYPPFRTNFDLDVVEASPQVGGGGQPSGLHVPAGAAITVVDDALDLNSQPALLETPVGAATWLRWDLTPAIEDNGVEAAFSMSADRLYNGALFDVAGVAGVRLRLRATSGGSLQLGRWLRQHTDWRLHPGGAVPRHRPIHTTKRLLDHRRR